MLPQKPHIYRKKSKDDNVGEHFMKHIQKLAKVTERIYAKNDPMIRLTDEEMAAHRKCTICYLCKKEFTKKDWKVQDHDHITGKFRGSSHNNCNLKNRQPRILPIFFHGLSNYDAHFIVHCLNAVPGRVEVIPNSEERYISFTKRIGNVNVRFVDSYRFISSSLAKIASTLPEAKFSEMKTHFASLFKKMNSNAGFDEEKFKLLLRKGVYCYDYTDSLEKLKEKQLPPKKAFYSELNQEDISQEDYDHAKKVWKAFDIANLGEYCDLYLKTDVLLLADIMEYFRKLCCKHYELDPAHYFTVPGLAWDAALKITQVELMLLQDYDMFMFFEEGIRGGVTTCVHRYAAANNPLVDGYDKDKPTVYIILWDANNLYGKAMSESLPTGGCDWVDKNEIPDISDMPDEGKYGWVLEVDVEYGEHLHDQHSDLPFLPVKEKPPGSNNHKLLTTLHKKVKYVAHYKFLKQAMKHGLKVTKIHRVIRYEQSPWLRKYIELNTQCRKDALNQFERDFFKLMNNAVFGKTMESERNRLNMKIVTTAKELQKQINKPNFLDRTDFGKGIVAVHLAKESIKMTKPKFVGQAVLDLSKITMYDFFYDVLKPRYQDKMKLLYGDTDSLCIRVECPDVYQDMMEMKQHFDFSNMPVDHLCQNDKGTESSSYLGKFKDETHGVPIAKFCGLRPKMYALQIGDKDKCKIKGIKANAIKTQIGFDDFLTCLETKENSKVSYRTITSKLHNVFTVESNKVALSADDDKRVILEDGITTLPYGHKDLATIEGDDVEMEEVNTSEYTARICASM